ncbi:MAG TPA: FAD-dependent oxidoreductase [Thermoanaerobaculia bacterium]|nr:FAD-dependent oxidoreductase [Thermoanaerobaculia bacterium]
MEKVELSRRDLLTAFLGAPLASLACRNRVRTSLPPGEIVGASDRVGHRLREAVHATPSDDAWQQHDVVIVGAGMSGLAAAWRLEHARFHDYLLLELEPVAGGTSRSGASRVSAYPWGAHYVPAPMSENRALIRLLGEMGVLEGGVVAEEHLCRDPQERIFFRGRWYDGLYLYAGAGADDLRQLRAFESEIAKWVGWRDARGRRAFTLPTAACSDDAEVMELDRMSMRAWLDRRGFNSPRLRWLVDYACRDDYGARLDDTSAWAGVFYFASRVPEPGQESLPLITWPEGNGRIAAHLSRAARGRIETGWLVANVVPTPGGVDVIAESGDGRHLRGIHAKRVIFAAPQFVAARVIAPYREEVPAHVREFTYGSWLVANLTLRDRPRSSTFPLAWDNVLYESPSLGYVVATHQSGIDYGATVLTYYYALCDADPRASRQRLLSANRDEWAEVALADLSSAHPEIREMTERLDVMRWGHAMIRPRPGLISGPARQAARQVYRNIHFAHSDLSGVALFEEALYHGVRSAEEVLRAGGRPVETFL